MAPEQLADSHALDRRADIYSLGATLYRLLAGVPVFDAGKYASQSARLQAIRLDPPPDITERRSGVSDELAAIIQRLLAKNPCDRFSTSKEVADVLTPFTAGCDLAELLKRAEQASTKQDEASDSQSAERGSGKRRTGRSRRLVWLTLLAALFLFAYLVVEHFDFFSGGIQYANTGPDSDTPGIVQPEFTGNDFAGVWFVNASSEIGGDGRSWRTAFRDLQTALDEARRFSPAKGQVWVSAGRYTPSPVQKNRDESFRLVNGVEILGGFSGKETLSHERRPREHLTILSGDLEGDDEPDFANHDENSYHVILSQGNDGTAILDGFVITAGYANAILVLSEMWEKTFPGEFDGGGILVDSGSPIFRGCIVARNFAGQRGGGISLWRSTATLTDCWFVENRSGYAGGGLINHGKFEHDQNGTLSIKDCWFWKNNAARGGGLVHWWGVAAEVERTLFAYNQTTGDHNYLGGAGVYNDATESTYIDCLIFHNTSAGPGGGVNAKWEPQARFVQCTIAGNSALQGRGAGVFAHNGGHPVLEHCLVWGNTFEQFGNGGEAEISVTRSYVEGGWPGEGNTDIVPANVGLPNNQDEIPFPSEPNQSGSRHDFEIDEFAAHWQRVHESIVR